MHKLVPSAVPNRGLLTGKWLHSMTQCIPDRAMKERFGIFSPDVRPHLLVWRLCKRLAFRIVDNPLVMWILKALGAERRARSALTDLYYYLIFRRNMLTGYYRAKQGVEEVST